MQKFSNCADYKVESKKALNGELEICYFKNSQDSAFLSWVFPKEIVYELSLWWKKLQKNNIQLFIVGKNRYL